MGDPIPATHLASFPLRRVFHCPEVVLSIQLMHGDCLERMKEIPDGSVDMVLSDPNHVEHTNHGVFCC